MSYRLYLDTSVFGALFDEGDQERVALTRAVLRRLRHSPYETFIGTPVYEEIGLAPPHIRRALEHHVADLSPTLIEEGVPSLRLTEAYMAARLVPPPKRNDARSTLRWPRLPISMRSSRGTSGTWSTSGRSELCIRSTQSLGIA